MNNNEKYFLSLIKSHLNRTTPENPQDIDFKEIYRLANINNVSAIIANEIQRLDSGTVPFNVLSAFRQQLGYTLIDFEEKESALAEVTKILNENKINYILVKGAVLRNYYPVKELRTSADTDIIINLDSLDRLKKSVKEHNYKIEYETSVSYSIKLLNQNIEIHSNNDFDDKYFINIFELCTNSENKFILNDYDHLLYIMCHIIKHFRSFGAGIKMFMDIDVLVRHIDNFDYDRFIAKCDSLEIGTFARSALSLCNYLFDTPVIAEIDFESNNDLRQLFADEIINGGSFGHSKRDIGDHYLIKTSKNGKQSKLRAFFKLLFPNSDYLRQEYIYASKHPILLPVAWLHRLFDGIFKRGSNSLNTITSIATLNNHSDYIRLLQELDIKK